MEDENIYDEEDDDSCPSNSLTEEQINSSSQPKHADSTGNKARNNRIHRLKTQQKRAKISKKKDLNSSSSDDLSHVDLLKEDKPETKTQM